MRVRRRRPVGRAAIAAGEDHHDPVWRSSRVNKLLAQRRTDRDNLIGQRTYATRDQLGINLAGDLFVEIACGHFGGRIASPKTLDGLVWMLVDKSIGLRGINE